jgi:hypothetical protein
MKQQRFGLIRGQTRQTPSDLVPGAEAVAFGKDREFRQLRTGFKDFRPSRAARRFIRKTLRARPNTHGRTAYAGL